jgi:hypothetical protein
MFTPQHFPIPFLLILRFHSTSTTGNCATDLLVYVGFFDGCAKRGNVAGPGPCTIIPGTQNIPIHMGDKIGPKPESPDLH